MRVITFSRYFPKGHPKAGQPTYFVEKIWKGLWDKEESGHNPIYPQWMNYDQAFPVTYDIKENIHNHQPKWHTIRAGNRWKVGDQYSPRVWSGRPYASKQIEFAPPITIEKIWEFGISKDDYFLRDESGVIKSVGFNRLIEIAQNDGLGADDFEAWFAIHPKKGVATFTGQILCHNSEISY
jgi:hypothetical protein